MKSSPPPPPPRSEWDFKSIIDLKPEEHWKIEQCAQWEYGREAYLEHEPFRKAVETWRAARSRTAEGFYGDDVFMQAGYHVEEDPISSLWFVYFPDWPERPFTEVKTWNPQPNRADLYPREGHGLQVDLEEIVQFPPDLEWQYWPSGSVLASSSSSIVALHLDWTRPLDDIKRQVDQWLSWAHKHQANVPKKPKLGNGHPTSKAQARLKWLTAYRLLRKHKRRHKEAASIYLSVYPEDRYKEQAEWINAAKSAKDLIKSIGRICETGSQRA